MHLNYFKKRQQIKEVEVINKINGVCTFESVRSDSIQSQRR